MYKIYMKAVCVSTPEWSTSLTWSFRSEFFRSPFATASSRLLDFDDHVNLYNNYHKQRLLVNLQIISTNDLPKRCSRCRHRLYWHGVCSLCSPLVAVNLSWSLKIYKIKAMLSKCHGNIKQLLQAYALVVRKQKTWRVDSKRLVNPTLANGIIF